MHSLHASQHTDINIDSSPFCLWFLKWQLTEMDYFSKNLCVPQKSVSHMLWDSMRVDKLWEHFLFLVEYLNVQDTRASERSGFEVVTTLIHPKSALSGSARGSSPRSVNAFFMDPTFCTGASSLGIGVGLWGYKNVQMQFATTKIL